MAWNPNDDRGKIINRKRKNQIVDFSGIRIENMTPMDVDGVIDLRNKGFIIIELKYRDAVLSRGQQIAYERMVDAIRNGDKECALFLCEHKVDNPEEDIDAASAIVRSYYYQGEWKEEGDVRLVELLNNFTYYVLHKPCER